MHWVGERTFGLDWLYMVMGAEFRTVGEVFLFHMVPYNDAGKRGYFGI